MVVAGYMGRVKDGPRHTGQLERHVHRRHPQSTGQLTVNVSAPSIPPVLLEVNGVTLQYKTPRHLVTATYQIDFSVHQGDRYVILGPRAAANPRC